MKGRPLLRGVRLVALRSTLLLLEAACSSTTTPATFTLSAAVDGTGSGSVIGVPVGIDVSTPDGARADSANGTTVTLTASAGVGSSFTGATTWTTADLDAPSRVAGITDPIALENPTFTNSSTGLSADVGASYLYTFENADRCLVSSNGGRTAMLTS